MCDIADAADLATELFLRDALTHRKPVVVNLICEWCEESPVAILPNGARARFCQECLPVATAA